MQDLSSCVLNNPLVRSIRDLLPGDAFLVGGCIRDMLLGREPLDYDLVVCTPVERIARDLAARFDAKPFWMDEKRGVLRIVLKPSGVSIDLSLPKGPDIGADLMARDLTINAMAWDISSGAFLDPCGGLVDLKNGMIRIISEKNLVDDPLRALRAIRFSVTLNFAIREGTCRMIRTHGDLLRQVSPERIKLEFARALDAPHSARFFRLLTWAGLIPVLFPQALTGTASERHLWHPVFSVAMPVADEMDQIIYAADALMPGSRAVLEGETEKEVKRSTMLRLAAFLLGMGEALLPQQPRAERDLDAFAGLCADFCASLRFSSPSCRMVRGALAGLAHADALLSRHDAGALDLYRFCRETAPVLPEALLLSLARAQAQEKVRRQNASTAWEYFRSVYSEYRKSPLITGWDVMEAVKGVSGPEVGRLLARVEEARARGLVGTKGEALDYLRSIAL